MKDKQKLWFKRRRYGYGWIPVTWEGAVTVISFIITIVFSSIVLLKDVERNTYQSEVGVFFIVLMLLIGIHLGITYKKGPSPKWRWGSKPTDNPETDY